MDEQWIKWEPIEGLPPKVYLERLVYDINGLFLEFTSTDGKTVTISLEDSIMAFRIANEGNRIKLISELSEKYGDDIFKWSFYEVKNSRFIRWLHEETFEISTNFDVKHYVFLACDDVFDLLTTSPPLVKKF